MLLSHCGSDCRHLIIIGSQTTNAHLRPIVVVHFIKHIEEYMNINREGHPKREQQEIVRFFTGRLINVVVGHPPVHGTDEFCRCRDGQAPPAPIAGPVLRSWPLIITSTAVTQTMQRDLLLLKTSSTRAGFSTVQTTGTGCLPTWIKRQRQLSLTVHTFPPLAGTCALVFATDLEPF